METIQPTLKRGRDVWDRVNMPKSEFLERVARIQERMGSQGIDVLLLYANSGSEYAGPCYISNYTMKVPTGAVAAIMKTGEAALIYEGFPRDVPGVKAATWIEDVRSCDDVSRQTVAFLKEKGLLPSTIGVAGLEQSMPHEQFRFFLKSAGGCTLIPVDEMIREMRTIKSPKETDQIRRAGKLVGFIFGELAQPAFSVTNEKALEAMMARQAYLEGAEDVRVLIAGSKEEGCGLRPCEDISLAAGETVILYLAVELDRYWAEGTRTLVYGENSFADAEPEPFKTFYEKVMAGLAVGKNISRFCKEIAAGAKARNIKILSEYGLGQGIGLSLHEAPLLREDEKAGFREGMCISLRLIARDGASGLSAIGETICLSGDGPEVLTGIRATP